MRRVRDFFISIIESKNKTLLAFCFCFILSVVICSIFSPPRNWLYAFYISLFVVLFFIILFFDKKFLRFYLAVIFFVIFGVCRVFYFFPEVKENFIAYYNGEKYEITGVITDEPNKKVGYREYELSVASLKDKNGIDKKVYGKVLFRFKSYPEYFYGDELSLSCSLQKPKNSENFNYQKFLAVKNIYSICYPDEIKIIARNSGNIVMTKILSFKRRVGDVVMRLWGEPQSTLAAGILYGERGGFDDELKDNFSRAGITHIVAVSGYNITIIVWILMSFLIFAGFYRQQAFWICLSLIFLFVIFTGSSASAVRAGLMGTLLLFAQFLGRKSGAFRLLVYAATLLAFFNPLILVWDVGFQLSFLATVGLLYLTPLLESKIINDRFKIYQATILKNYLLPTLAATIFTFPLISYSFGYFSILSILANLFVIWLIPILMLMSFMSIIATFVFFPLGQVFAWITNLGLSYVIMIGDTIGGWSFSAINWQVSLLVCLGCYVGLFWLILDKKIQF